MFLVRDLVSPRTWLAMISHLAGLVIGFAVIFVFTFGLSLGFSLVVIALVGLPVLGVTLRFAEWFATAERARLGLMLGVRIPAWPAEARAGYRWGIVPRWRMLTVRASRSRSHRAVRSPRPSAGSRRWPAGSAPGSGEPPCGRPGRGPR